MRKAYLTDMVHVFPENERKPCDAIYDEMLQGKFLAFGLFAGGELLAYALIARMPGCGYLFAQYVVVKEAYRSRGLGGMLMDEVAKRCGAYRAVMVDVEDPEFGADDAERDYREKRVRFYLKNGFRTTRVKARVCGVDYLVMARELSTYPSDEEIFEASDALYRSMAMPGAFPYGFRVFLRPEERGMARATWKRLADRQFRMARVETEDFCGTAGLIEIGDVLEPLRVRSVLSEVVIADAGYSWLQLSPDEGGWWLTVMYDAGGELVQYYFDVTLRNYIAQDGEPRFVDLYLDVVMDPTGRWVLLDQDELDEALAAGNITEAEYKLATERAEHVIGMVNGREAYWRALCARCLDDLREPVAR